MNYLTLLGLTVVLPLSFPQVADVLVPTLRAIPIFFTLLLRLVNFDILDLAFCAQAFGAHDALFQGILLPSVDTNRTYCHLVPSFVHVANIERTIYTPRFVKRAWPETWLLGGHP